MTENFQKQCTKCKVLRGFNDFKDGRLQCNVCLDAKKRYREKHREEIKHKRQEYYQSNKEQFSQYYKNIPKVECPLCTCLVGMYAMKQHEQTIKHQLRLKAIPKKEAQRNREAWSETYMSMLV